MSDLHLGLVLNGFSMLEDQKYILKQAIELCLKERVDILLLCGDIYDRSNPSIQAVSLFDSFLQELFEKKIQVMIIPGNHDASERIAYASSLLSSSGVYLCPNFQGKIYSYRVEDMYGPLFFHFLPFIRPADLRPFFEEEKIGSYDDAIDLLIGNLPLDKKERNILLCHQFVQGSIQSDSERVHIGGTEGVDRIHFKDFDYVAMGHIHRPQWMVKDQMRYCGSPLKYSFSEAGHSKSLTIVDMKEKGNMDIFLVPLHPRRDVRILEDYYEDLMDRNLASEDYLKIILKDEEEIHQVMNKLRKIYPNLMQIEYNNRRTKENRRLNIEMNLVKKDPFDLVQAFYKEQNNQDLSDQQKQYIKKCIDKIWGQA